LLAESNDEMTKSSSDVGRWGWVEGRVG
jgi:hypothetical protein